MTQTRQVMVLAAIFAVVAVVDFAQRIHVPRAATTRESTIEMPAMPAPPLSLALARERLQSWFPTAMSGQQTAAAATERGESAAALPDRGDIGGWRFVLRGVFDAGPPFAVLDVMSTSGAAVEQHRLSAGQTIKGVRVEQINGRRVSLSAGEKTIQLALFVDPENDVAPADEPNE